jgi:hypothetical protein
MMLLWNDPAAPMSGLETDADRWRTDRQIVARKR